MSSIIVVDLLCYKESSKKYIDTSLHVFPSAKLYYFPPEQVPLADRESSFLSHSLYTRG